MGIIHFKALLQLNRELSNTLHTMSDAEKATTKGGKVFMNVHKTDIRIGHLVAKNATFQSIVEKGDY
jgi:hypothetical protein